MSLDAWIGREFAGKKIVGVDGKNALWKDSRGIKITTPFAYLARFYEYDERIPDGTEAEESQVRCFPMESLEKILLSFRAPVTAQLVLTNMGVDITKRGLVVIEKALELCGMVRRGRVWERGPHFLEGQSEQAPAVAAPMDAAAEMRAFVMRHTVPGGCAPLRSLHLLWTGEELTPEQFAARMNETGFKVKDAKFGAVIYGLRVKEETRMETKTKSEASAAIEKAASAIQAQLVDPELADVMAEIKAQTEREAQAIDTKYESMKRAMDDWRTAARKAAFNNVRVKLGLAQPSDEVSIAEHLLRESLDENLGKA